MALTRRQERFCHEYLADCGAAQAYLRAGYRSGDPAAPAARLLANPDIQEKIGQLKAERQSALIATPAEVLQTLIRVLRGEEGDPQGERPSPKTPLTAVSKAAELLGKYHGLWTDKMALEAARPVILDDIRGGPPEGEADG